MSGHSNKVKIGIAVGVGTGIGFAGGVASILLYNKYQKQSYIDLRQELSLVRHELESIRHQLATDRRSRTHSQEELAAFSVDDQLSSMTDDELDDFFDAPEWPTQVHFKLPPSSTASTLNRSFTSLPDLDEAEELKKAAQETLGPKVIAEQSEKDDQSVSSEKSRDERDSQSTASLTRSRDGSLDSDEENGYSSASKIDIKIVYERTDRWLKSEKLEDRYRAYSLMRKVYESGKGASDAEFLWRFARTTYLTSQIIVNDEGKRKQLVFESKTYAFIALQLNFDDADIHKWCALTLGTATDFMGMSDKIQNGYLFKFHIDKALELRPNDSVLHHLCGRWCFGVAELSWLERKVAATLFADPPTSSYDEALDQFLQAEKLSTEAWIANKLFVAKCYKAMNELPLSLPFLREASVLRAVGQDEIQALKEVEAMISKSFP